MKYSIWKAVSYEVTNILIDFDTKWEQNFWVKKVREHCFMHWVEWKTDRTMEQIDREIEDFHSEADYQMQLNIKRKIIEHEPNGSEAQELLGGAIQIKSAWSAHEREEY